MAITLRQSGAPASAFSTSQTITLASASVVGNLLVLVVEHQATGTVSITDNGNNTWTRRVASENGATAASGQYKIDIWTAPVTTSNTTITLTNTASSVLGGTYYELAGAGTIRATAIQYQSVTTDPPALASINFNSGDFAVAAISYFKNAQANTVASPWTITGSGSGTSTTRYAAASYLATADQTTGPQWTTSGASNSAAQVVLAVAPASTGGTVALSGTGTYAASGTPIINASVAFTGEGTLASAGNPSISGTIAFAGAGTFSATGGATETATLALSGEGTLSSTGTPNISAQIALTGNGHLSSTGNPVITGRADFTGNGTLAFADTIATTGQLDLTGSGLMTATGTPVIASSITLEATGVLHVEGSARIVGRVDLTGAGDFSAIGSSSSAGLLTLTGNGQLSSTGHPTITGTLPLSGSGQMTGAGTPRLGGVLVATATGDLTTADGIPVLFNTLAMTGLGLLTLMRTQAEHRLILRAHLADREWSAGATRTAPTASLDARRWKAHL